MKGGKKSNILHKPTLKLLFINFYSKFKFVSYLLKIIHGFIYNCLRDISKTAYTYNFLLILLRSLYITIYNYIHIYICRYRYRYIRNERKDHLHHDDKEHQDGRRKSRDINDRFTSMPGIDNLKQ